MKTHILLIDDDSEELPLLCAGLDTLSIDYKCTWAKGVTHAMQIMQYIRPDYIFIDNQMPETGGPEGIRIIKRDPQLCNIPVVLYSGALTEELRRKAFAAGATACVKKPSCADDFAGQLGGLLEPKMEPETLYCN